ncbi:MAG: GNAT family N-acetyltransferase [bacterium]|nr:GNAT family N-acetyltransferase [bacterium]
MTNIFMPTLETERLRIRRFTIDDLPCIHQVYVDAGWDEDTAEALEKRRAWLQWQVMNYAALEGLYQPPYGDRAVERKDSGEFVGSVGLVQAFGPFGQLPHYQALGISHRLNMPEFGLFWAFLKAQQGKGYATEAAQAVVDFALKEMRLKRMIATTEHDNTASQAVMRRLGMKIERNPLPEPVWFQVVGILENEGEES